MIKLVLVRHGQSVWNLENRFTGWTDVDLTDQGIEEAKEAGRKLVEAGYDIDIAYTSVLKRANRTLDIILKEMGDREIEVVKSWKLNERHYGALQGLNKAETAEKMGEEQVHIWRRSYDVRPPALEVDDPRCSFNDPLYAELDKSEIPLTECLKDTVERVVPYYESEIVPALSSGKQVMIVAHGNSLRALIKYLDNISDEEIIDLNIPTGKPLVYELTEGLNVARSYYL